MSENDIADEKQSVRGPLAYSVETLPPELKANGNQLKAEDKQSFRGPLKYVVETSAPQLEAGRNTSIFLLITNPYDLPITIVSAQTKVPVEFKDAARDSVSFWKGIWKEAIKEADLDKLQVVSGVSLSDESNNRQTPSPVILQPGNTTIYEFKLRTRQAHLFTPAVHNLNAQVQYEMNGTTNHDVVKYQLNIRAPLKALLYGSVVGSITGTILRFIIDATESNNVPTLAEIFVPKFYLSIVAGILIGSVLVIAFARKKDAQPFITIEDFWGGFFIGFLAGYVGKSLLNPLLPTQQMPG